MSLNIIRRASKSYCRCNQSTFLFLNHHACWFDANNHHSSLANLLTFSQAFALWKFHLFASFSFEFSSSLHVHDLISRDERHVDFRVVNWRSLLSDQASTIQLNFALFERHFFDFHDLNHLKLILKYDVDEFVAHVHNLKLFKWEFKLLSQSRFLQQITKN